MASPHIHEISSIELDSGVTGSFGIDEDGALYWNGHAVVMKQKISLDRWVNISFLVTAASTLVIAVFSALTYLCPR
jgi:hypothetical protein